MSWGSVEMEPEVRDLLEGLPGRRIILLTVFVKTKDGDRKQVERAKKAMLNCIEAKHIVDDDEGRH